jgi:hypothetical protein
MPSREGRYGFADVEREVWQMQHMIWGKRRQCGGPVSWQCDSAARLLRFFLLIEGDIRPPTLDLRPQSSFFHLTREAPKNDQALYEKRGPRLPSVPLSIPCHA